MFSCWFVRVIGRVPRTPRLVELVADAPNAEGAGLFGLFYDKKDVHFQVEQGQARQSHSAGALKGHDEVGGVRLGDFSGVGPVAC